jgi:chemotaxis protein MotB
MKTIFKTLVFLMVGTMFLSSCVSNKKFNELQAEKDAMSARYEKQLADMKKDFGNKEAEFNTRVTGLTNENSTLKSDVNKYMNLSEENARALDKIKKEINEAFAGFDNPDLKIIQRFDKLYVSLPNKILYKKGSDKLSKEGNEVLNALATIFKNNPDMDIIVEGHTDNEPVRVTKHKFRDNWGLSTSRALNALRYLVGKGVPEGQLTAAGRADQVTTGELLEGKDKQAHDRRIEFILTPDVHKLYNIKQSLK